MANYRIDLSLPAENDLRDILHYIATQLLEPQTALEMLNFIEAEVNTLSFMPQRQPLIRDKRLAKLGYRLLPVKNYLVFYSINEEEQMVNIERILYKRRNWHHLL